MDQKLIHTLQLFNASLTAKKLLHSSKTPFLAFPNELEKKLRFSAPRGAQLGSAFCFDKEGGQIFYSSKNAVAVLALQLSHELVHAQDLTLRAAINLNEQRSKLLLQSEQRAYAIQNKVFKELARNLKGFSQIIDDLPDSRMLRGELTKKEIEQLYEKLFQPISTAYEC